MPTPFGPQLIGETEKSLNTILVSVLTGTGLTERQWVTLRLASLGDTNRAALVAALADRAHFPDAGRLVDELTGRGLLDGGRLTAEGRALTESVHTVIVETTSPIWSDLSADDLAAAERLLNEVLRRSRAVLNAAR